MADLKQLGTGDPTKPALVFIHGLGGDPINTWRHASLPASDCWPYWVCRDTGCDTWVTGYDAALSAWRDQAMPLPDQGDQIADLLASEEGLKDRRLVLIGHSMGGLVMKTLLIQCRTKGDPRMKKLADRLIAMVFIATPHAGSELASLAHALKAIMRTNAQVGNMSAHDPHLRQLNNQFREAREETKLSVKVFAETQDVSIKKKIFFFRPPGGFRVVNPTSSDPGLQGVTVVPMAGDHFSICKPVNRGAQIHKSLCDFINELPAGSEQIGPPPRFSHQIPVHAVSEVGSYTRDKRRIPRQLPDRPVGGHLFGRDTALRELTLRLKNGEHSAVVGDAGLGKTALAAEAVRAVIGNDEIALLNSPFPDGVVLLDLYRLKGGADSVWNALANALIAGEQATLPARARAEAACRHRRTLIVIEGAEEADGHAPRARLTDLLDVLDPANRYLILTRDSTQVPASITVKLADALDAAAAGELFDQITGQSIDPMVRSEVLQLLQGHPLALTWAANLLARGDESPQQLCKEWRRSALPGFSDPSNSRHTLQWLFGRSVQRLSETERTALDSAGLLAHAELPLTAIIASLENEENARAALKRLVQLGLLRRSSTREDHWHFTHILGYQFARRETGADAKLLGQIAQWAQNELEGQLKRGDLADLPRTLAHISALLRADDRDCLWVLAEFCLYTGVGRIWELGQLDLVVQFLNGVDSWFDRLPLEMLSEAPWQRERSVVFLRLGDVQAAQGDSGAALKSYQAGLVIAERLAAGDPHNTQWQRDLSVSYDRIGNVQTAQGDSGAALKSYQAGRAIRERLVAGDPHNTQWQRDLSLSYEKIGNVQAAQGDSGAALKSYQVSLGIRERLAAGDPHNTEWQRDLSVSYNKIGDVQAAQGDSGAALKSYQAGLVIAERLAASDPHNTQWQRDMSYTLTKLAEVEENRGNVTDALKYAEVSLAVDERLAALDPSNSTWQNDVLVSRNIVARLLGK